MKIGAYIKTAAFATLTAIPYLLGAGLQTIIEAWKAGRKDVRDAT